MQPGGRGGEQGSPGGAVQRGTGVKRVGGDGRAEAGGWPRGLGRGGKKGRGRGAGGGRGRKQCSRRGPGGVPLPNAFTQVRFGNVAPAAGGCPGRWIGGRGVPPSSTPRRLRRSQAGCGGRHGWPGHGPDGGAAGRSPRSDPTPAGPPGRERGGAGAGGRWRSRRRQPSSARPRLRWEEARRPGERKRGPDPPPAAARLREGACPERGGAGASGAAPPAGRRGECGGCVRARALPPPARPLLKAPEGPCRSAVRLRATSERSRSVAPGLWKRLKPGLVSSTWICLWRVVLTHSSKRSFIHIFWSRRSARPCSGVP